MAKRTALKIGDDVTWKWGMGEGQGKVTKVHTKDTEANIKGAHIKRKASPDKPAVEIKTNKGQKVLKSVTETKAK